MSSHTELLKLLQDLVDESATALRVCLPGRIESYDPDTMLANVQPLLKIKFYGAQASQLLPIVNNVPVCHPRTGTALLRLPVAPGDLVTLVFADRSLENYLQGQGEAKETLDTRKHHLSDAFAFLGGYPGGMSQAANNPNAAELVVSSGTKITVGNGSEELLQLAHDAFTKLKELVDKLSDTLADIQLITHTETGSVTGPPLNASSFATHKTTVDQISTDVQTVITDLEKIKV